MKKQIAILTAVVSLALSAAAQQEAASTAIRPGNATTALLGTTTNAMPAAVLLPAAAGLGSPQPLPAAEALAPVMVPSPMIIAQPAPIPEKPTHSFIDKRNLAVFSALAAARTMDMISTWQFRRHGLNEGELSNAFVDNKPAFVAFSGSLVAGQIAASYFFHRVGWHKAERISAMIHTGVVTESVIHNYRLH